MTDIAQNYVENGFFESVISDDGEEFFVLSENAETIDPLFYKECIKELEDQVIRLVEMGLVDVDFTDEGVPMYSVSELGTEAVKTLSE